MTMRAHLICTFAALTLAGPAAAQDIVKVPAGKAGVSLPEDIFALPAGQWFVAKQVSQGTEPCTPEACEAGFNSGDFVVSVEHAGQHVQVIAGFRGCQGVAFQEMETGMKPGSGTRGEVSYLLKKVVKAAEKSCKLKAPAVPKLDVAALFPKGAT